ncbi:hypothetical protein GCM10011324_20990 [Allosediminivita pacifica]|nr:hypothetical protein GCM10011324_20990 [Allosediminivita pacifica]
MLDPFVGFLVGAELAAEIGICLKHGHIVATFQQTLCRCHARDTPADDNHVRAPR